MNKISDTVLGAILGIPCTIGTGLFLLVYGDWFKDRPRIVKYGLILIILIFISGCLSYIRLRTIKYFNNKKWKRFGSENVEEISTDELLAMLKGKL